VGVALGQFQPATAEAYFVSKKLPIVKVRTFSLFAFGGGSGRHSGSDAKQQESADDPTEISGARWLRFKVRHPPTPSRNWPRSTSSLKVLGARLPLF
jgi:hypothetical protein